MTNKFSWQGSAFVSVFFFFFLASTILKLTCTQFITQVCSQENKNTASHVFSLIHKTGRGKHTLMGKIIKDQESLGHF